MSVKGFQVGSGNVEQYDYNYLDNKPANLVQDASYVHTDNNFTTEEKTKLSGIEEQATKTVIDATLTQTGQAADAKAAGDRLAVLDDVSLAAYATDTATGAIASFSDGADDIPMKSVTCAINPVQDLHGYENPWPAGGGKNKLPPYADGTYTSGNLTVESVNGVVTVNGSGAYVGNIPETTMPSTVYIHALNNQASGDIAIGFLYNETQYDYIALREVNRIVDLSSALGGKTINQIRIVSNITVTDLHISPMATTDGVETPWTPYSNICPISGFTGLTLNRTGKNLINQSGTDANNGYLHKSYIQITGAVVSAEGDWDIMEYTSVLPSTQYTISGLTANNVTGYAEYDADKNMVASGAYQTAPFTFTTTSKTRYVRFNRNYANDNTIMLNLGSTAETYAPYQGNTYPVSWQTEAGMVYGGTLDVTTGVLTVDREGHIFDGTETIVEDVDRFRWTAPNVSPTRPGEIQVISSIYPSDTANQLYLNRNKTGYIGIAINAGALLIVDNVNFPTKDAVSFTSYLSSLYLSGTPLIAVWKLATPQTYQLTPTEVDSLLGENRLWHDANGNTTANYRADTTLYIAKKIAALS